MLKFREGKRGLVRDRWGELVEGADVDEVPLAHKGDDESP